MNERVKSWVYPGAVALLAFVLRVWQLGRPPTLSFDEQYYAQNAWSMLQLGYAERPVDESAKLVAQGDLTHLFIAGQPEQVVHPDAGKWMIAAGEAVFGMDAFGWRIASAVIGALTVLVLCRLVLRLTHSVGFACLAGFLVALDGLSLTMSRLALLDIFLTFWILCAMACLVADRDAIASRMNAGDSRFRLWRPWQLAAGVCLGLACGTKWSGLYALAAFGIAIVAWEFFLRMSHRRDRPIRTLFAVGIPAFCWLVPVAAVVYVVANLGWLVNHETYEERFGHGYGDEKAWGAYLDEPNHNPLSESADALRSFWHYQGMSYRFHTGDFLAKATHPYQSDAIGWLVMKRPVSAAVDSNIPSAKCGADADDYCMRETLLLGNIAVWWSGVIAMFFCLAALLIPTKQTDVETKRWAYSVPVIGLIATWVPWLPINDRPIFSFYAVTTLPFLAIALALVLNDAVRHAHTTRQRYFAWLLVGGLVTLTTAAAMYFWPIWTHELISRDAWNDRMWFKTWI